jgi:hypothetical protein
MMAHLRYLKSVLRHKWFVFVECCRLGIPLLGIVHDLSKFLPSEWSPYVRFFYGPQPPPEATKADFDVAWLHHQHRNKHHWQRWILRLDHPQKRELVLLPMPDKYRREMLADWNGAGKAYGNPDTRGWYLEHKDEMQLHSATRQWIEEQLGIIQ